MYELPEYTYSNSMQALLHMGLVKQQTCDFEKLWENTSN
jgi:hypothetical protein